MTIKKSKILLKLKTVQRAKFDIYYSYSVGEIRVKTENRASSKVWHLSKKFLLSLKTMNQAKFGIYYNYSVQKEILL